MWKVGPLNLPARVDLASRGYLHHTVNVKPSKLSITDCLKGLGFAACGSRDGVLHHQHRRLPHGRTARLV